MEEILSEVMPSGSDRAPVGKAQDAFTKAFQFRRADEAVSMGMHPYFKAIASQHGGTVTVGGREMVITGSNDYLGLTQDPRLKEAARRALDDFGTSCTGSRFLTGTLTLHEELEQRLAVFFQREAVLTFSAGFLGCLSVVSALAGRHDILYYDRENHASLYDAARLSYATLRKYEHGDLADLERMLEADAGKPGGRIIVTDGVFSMSGHIADLPGIVKLKKRFGARLIVDDAHASGVLGKHGRGTGVQGGQEHVAAVAGREDEVAGFVKERIPDGDIAGHRADEEGAGHAVEVRLCAQDLGEEAIGEIANGSVGQALFIRDHAQDGDSQLSELRKMRVPEIVDVGDVVDDDAAKASGGEAEALFEKGRVIEDQIPVSADDHQPVRIQRGRDGERIEVDGDAVAQVPAALDEDEVLILADAGQDFAELFPGRLLIEHVQEFGMMKPNAHVFWVFLQFEKARDQGGIVVPEPLLAIQEAFAEGLHVADLLAQCLGHPNDDAGFSRSLPH